VAAVAQLPSQLSAAHSSSRVLHHDHMSADLGVFRLVYLIQSAQSLFLHFSPNRVPMAPTFAQLQYCYDGNEIKTVLVCTDRYLPKLLGKSLCDDQVLYSISAMVSGETHELVIPVKECFFCLADLIDTSKSSMVWMNGF
jgi:hypothetical protein